MAWLGMDISREPIPGKRGEFVYRINGKRITSARKIARIERLAVPPAWNDVRIAASPAAKLQATGIDAAGRTQAIYHPAYRRRQERAKFERILRFAEKLPRLRRQVERDLRRRTLSREKVVACVIKLMDEQFFRVGNKTYAEQHESYGVTTLRRKHVSVDSSTVRFDFVGKSGKRHRRTVRDPQLARLVKQLRELRGYEIFRFFDDDGMLHDVDSRHVNAYVKEFMGDDFSAKDFRTWGGTLLAVSALLAAEHPEENTAALMRDMVRQVAERLGNTPAVTKASYIHPRVFAIAEDRVTLSKLRETMTRMQPRRYLSVEEQCVLKLLETG